MPFDPMPGDRVRLMNHHFSASRQSRSVRICLLLGIGVLSACSSSEIAPVSGRVTLNGEPVGPGTVMFMPDSKRGTKGKAATGHFGEDGTYQLGTHKEDDGALIGHHKVIIRPRSDDDAEGGADAEGFVHPRETSIPLKYGNPRVPELEFEVQPGANQADFDLSS